MEDELCKPPSVYTYVGFDIEGRDPCDKFKEEKSCTSYPKCKWDGKCSIIGPRPTGDNKWYLCQDPLKNVTDKNGDLLPIAKSINLTSKDQIVIEGSYVIVPKETRLVFPEITSCSVWIFEFDSGMRLGYHAEVYQLLEGIEKFRVNYEVILNRLEKYRINRVWIVSSTMYGEIAKIQGHLDPVSPEFLERVRSIAPMAIIERYQASDCWVTLEGNVIRCHGSKMSMIED